MTSSLWMWLVVGIIALLGGAGYVLMCFRRTPEQLRAYRRVLGIVTAVGLGVALGWSLSETGELPAATAALVLLAFGALAAASFVVAGSASKAHPFVWGLTLAGVGVTVVAAPLLALGGEAEMLGTDVLLLIRLFLAGLGAGVWLPAALASGFFAAGRVAQEAAPAAEHPTAGRPVDPGRLPAVIGFPLLTAALLAAVLWNVLGYAAAWRNALPDLWLLVTWLLGVAYLHATSPWHPLGLPRWFQSLLAAAACGAAVLSALSAGALLVG